MVKRKERDDQQPDPRYNVVRVPRPTANFKRPATYDEVFFHYRAAAHHYEDQANNFKIEASLLRYPKTRDKKFYEHLIAQIVEASNLAVQEHRIAAENSFIYENEPLKITAEVDVHTLRVKEAKLKVKESLFYYSGAHAVDYIEFITGFGDGNPVLKPAVEELLNSERLPVQVVRNRNGTINEGRLKTCVDTKRNYSFMARHQASYFRSYL